MPKVLVRDEPDFVDRPTCGFRPYLHEAVVFSQMYWKFTDADAGLYRGTQHEAGIEGRYDAPRVYLESTTAGLSAATVLFSLLMLSLLLSVHLHPNVLLRHRYLLQ